MRIACTVVAWGGTGVGDEVAVWDSLFLKETGFGEAVNPDGGDGTFSMIAGASGFGEGLGGSG